MLIFAQYSIRSSREIPKKRPGNARHDSDHGEALRILVSHRRRKDPDAVTDLSLADRDHDAHGGG